MTSGADQRQRLLEALAVEVSKNGYGGTKIQDIAREAKVSLRTFYAEFPNKEACFLALYGQLTQGLLQLIKSSVTFEGSWRDEMAKGFSVHTQALESAPRITYAFMIELATLSPEARLIRQAWLDEVSAMVCEQVERGRQVYRDIPSRSLSPMMARAILGGVTEMIVDLIVRNDMERLPEVVEVATDMLWSAVTNVPAAEASADVPVGVAHATEQPAH